MFQVATKFIGFLPDKIFTIVSELGTRRAKLFSPAILQQELNIPALIGDIQGAEKEMHSIRVRLTQKARSLLGVDPLSQDNQKLWLSREFEMPFSGWWNTIKMLREMRKGL